MFFKISVPSVSSSKKARQGTRAFPPDTRPLVLVLFRISSFGFRIFTTTGASGFVAYCPRCARAARRGALES